MKAFVSRLSLKLMTLYVTTPNFKSLAYMWTYSSNSSRCDRSATLDFTTTLVTTKLLRKFGPNGRPLHRGVQQSTRHGENRVPQCSSTLEMTEGLLDNTLLQDSPLFFRCLKYACAECSQKLRVTGYRMVCGHTPRCPIAPF